MIYRAAGLRPELLLDLRRALTVARAVLLHHDASPVVRGWVDACAAWLAGAPLAPEVRMLPGYLPLAATMATPAEGAVCFLVHAVRLAELCGAASEWTCGVYGEARRLGVLCAAWVEARRLGVLCAAWVEGWGDLPTCWAPPARDDARCPAGALRAWPAVVPQRRDARPWGRGYCAGGVTR